MCTYFFTLIYFTFPLKIGRWVVEHQVGRKDLAINECDSKQSIYVYGCKDSVLQVNGNLYEYIFTSDILCSSGSFSQ